MPCSGCGQSGHNIRTCGGGGSLSSSYSSSTSNYHRISSVTCSGCGQSGHNIRTCGRGSVGDSIQSHRSSSAGHACSGCGRSGHNIRTCDQNFAVEKPGKSGNTCSGCGKTGHNIRTCDRQSSRSEQACSGCGREGHNIRTCDSAQIKSVNERACSCCGKTGHNIRTCDKVQAEKETKTEKTCSRCGRTGHDIRTCEKPSADSVPKKHEKDCARCGKSGHSVQECTSLGVEVVKQDKKDKSKEEKEYEKLLIINNLPPKLSGSGKNVEDKDVFHRDKNFKPNSYLRDTSPVRNRILEGPREDDGPGHIYMYRIANRKEVPPGDESTFKIGQTRDLPQRRIRAQERRNEEAYAIVETVEVAYRKLTEKVIHLQLESRKHERDVEDGYTEWFVGQAKRLVEVIRDAKAIVERNHPGNESAVLTN